MIGDDLRELLGARVPRDHAGQTLADAYVARFFEGLDSSPSPEVMDLGCGPGDSVELFRRFDRAVRWVGVDIEESPEVRARTRTDAEFRTFDGVHIPFEDGRFDLVYCKQVLEHVRRPQPLLEEAARVLRPGGQIAGSTSHLEPFHSYSVWNYSPYGLAVLLEEAGLEVLELRPGIDALTLIVHRGLGMPRWFHRWWARESPLNRAIDAFARLARLDAAGRNVVKLLFCGQFAFLARKPDGAEAAGYDAESRP